MKDENMRGRKNVKAGEGWWSRPADRAQSLGFSSFRLPPFLHPSYGLGQEAIR